MFAKYLENVRGTTPLVHCLTNYVTVNDCANALLACGASPIMADDLSEVAEITTLCNATVVNIGTLNERTIKSMLVAAQTANKIKHALVLDPVGAGASDLRTHTAHTLLDQADFTVIRGNISEIKALALKSNTTKGVDANLADQINDGNLQESLQFIRSLSIDTNSIIAVSGALDVISDSHESYIIKNGHPAMSKITGSGCMLTCLIAAYIAANPENVLQATAAAVALMGIAGEMAAKINTGTGSMRSNILDALSSIDGKILEENIKIEKF